MAIEMPPMVEVRKLTLDDVLEMVAAEIIKDTERVELVDGVLVTMSPEGKRHADVITWLNRVMTDTYAAPIEVRVNLTRPLEGPHNFRVPDLLIVQPAGPTRWADPEEVILAVEVSLTSLRNDLGPKAVAYARWGAPAYWVLDLVHDTLVVHTDPSQDGYRSVARLRSDDEVRFPGVDRVICAADLFGMPTYGSASDV
jgi:Uma2 family endonuclease